MKKRITFLSFVIIALFVSSCCKAIFETETKLNNKTNDKLEFRFFSSGKYDTQSFGAVTQDIPIRNMINSPYDSILVIVNGNLLQVHLRSQMTGTPRKSIDIIYNDKRNLFNPANYITNEQNLACDGKRTLQTYSFQ
ncbi:hypothetical protein [Pedobacter rhizosphaerae]|uniref:Lipoprotein n=1 Tax=Pedobacter rhizosphaerae TaxID=390241 RepID=A0A1H9R2I2_9SPHI|nr:hypothetical protein [Pedobacter rhizosphaerae]SER66910.1 hypothetical protein SAMN04488023_113100 [Pedobacter rhizosphaerae]